MSRGAARVRGPNTGWTHTTKDQVSRSGLGRGPVTWRDGGVSEVGVGCPEGLGAVGDVEVGGIK